MLLTLHALQFAMSCFVYDGVLGALRCIAGLARMRSVTMPTLNPEAGTPAYMAPECYDVNNDVITSKAVSRQSSRPSQALPSM